LMATKEFVSAVPPRSELRQAERDLFVAWTLAVPTDPA